MFNTGVFFARPSLADLDALLRLNVDLAYAVFGVDREIAVDTAVVCPTCTGSRCKLRRSPTATCRPGR